MPTFNTKLPAYKPQKKLDLKWDGWSGGWVNVYDETEIKETELKETVNLMLTGRGAVTGRWGTDTYFQAGSGRVRGLHGFYDTASGIAEPIALTDTGYLVKKANASYGVITGASFASGYPLEMSQLGGYLYLVGGNKELTKYDGSTLAGFPTIAKPTDVAVSNFSGATGGLVWGWRISAVSQVGETLASDSVTLSDLPQVLSESLFRISWTAVSTASGVLKGYTIYRGQPGGETFVGSVGSDTTVFWDYGEAQSDVVFPPNADTTGGPKAKFIFKLDDRLIVGGFDDDPSLLMVSARYPYESRFHWADGGGYVRISPDDGEKIMGISVVGSNVKGGSVPSTVLVFKERSTYAMVLKSVSIGNYSILDLQYQKLLPFGATSSLTVKEVENDVFFLSRDGIYTAGSEPNYLNEIRSKEMSTRIREYMQGLSDSDYSEACAGYIQHKYILAFPTRKEAIVYDYERKAFMGPWKFPWGITNFYKFYDTSGVEYWLIGCTDGYVRNFSASLINDSGTAFRKSAVTRKEDFGDWTIMKIVELFHILMRNVKGNVNITILGEDRSGVTSSLKTFTISGNSVGNAGYGTAEWGDELYGESEASVSITSEDFIRWSQLYKTIRVVQVEVTSTEASANWELINMRMIAQPLGTGSLSPTTRA